MSEEGSLIPAIGISASGLDAQARRMEVIANNVANAHSTRATNGKLFKRKQIIFSEKLERKVQSGKMSAKGRGVTVNGVVEENSPARLVFQPGHPDADRNGFVHMPDINPVEEMVHMMSASRAYEANLSAIKSARDMARQALMIGKK